MTSEEAIEILQRSITVDTALKEQAILIAINAVRKQIPMKMPGTYTDYRCAICGRRIRSGKGSSSFTRDNFCQKCGQAIDWEGKP